MEIILKRLHSSSDFSTTCHLPDLAPPCRPYGRQLCHRVTTGCCTSASHPTPPPCLQLALRQPPPLPLVIRGTLWPPCSDGGLGDLMATCVTTGSPCRWVGHGSLPLVPRVQMCDRCRGIAVLGPMVENTVLLLGLSSAGMSRPGQTSDCGSCSPRGSANRDETPTLPEALPQASTEMRFSQRTYYWKGNKNTELFLFLL